MKDLIKQISVTIKQNKLSNYKWYNSITNNNFIVKKDEHKDYTIIEGEFYNYTINREDIDVKTIKYIDRIIEPIQTERISPYDSRISDECLKFWSVRNPDWDKEVNENNKDLINTKNQADLKLIYSEYSLKSEECFKSLDKLNKTGSCIVDKEIAESIFGAKSIKQSESSRTFESGAKRDNNVDKPFVHNILGYTRLRFGYHMTLGASKYSDQNWRKGMPTDSYLESVDRHLAKYIEGDRTEDHLSAIIFGIQGCMINEQKEGIEVDKYYKLLKDK